MNGLLNYFHNQFFTGGLLLMIGGGLMAFCRNVPYILWEHFLRQFTVSATVRSTDMCFDFLCVWLDTIPYTKRARQVEVTLAKERQKKDLLEDDECATPAPGPSAMSSANVLASKKPKLRFLFTPALGQHVLIYRGKLLWLSRTRGDPTVDPGSSSRGFASLIEKQAFSLRFFGRQQEPIRQLMEDAAEIATAPEDDSIPIFVSTWDYWSKIARVKPRLIESVVLPEGMWELLIRDATQFLKSYDWYYSMGIPYRRSYLFYGTPGSGKTATVQALAGHLKLPLYILTLSNHGLTDEGLNRMLLSVPYGSVVLLEDIDAAFEQRKKANGESESKVTFSGLLNAIDGAASSQGRLLFMTTNHVDKLDPALIRPGRADVKLEFGLPTSDQVERLYLRFYPQYPQTASAHARAFCAEHRGNIKSMAQAQEILVERALKAVSPVQQLEGTIRVS